MTRIRTRDEYLAQLAAALRTGDESTRCAIVDDMRDHFVEANWGGQSDSEIIARLGNPAALALAFELELGERRLNDGARFSGKARFLPAILAAAALSFPTLILVCVLGSIALALLVSGAAISVAGILLVAGFDPQWIRWPRPTAEAFWMGPGLALLGAMAGWLLKRYLDTVRKALRSLLPIGKPSMNEARDDVAV